MRVSRRAEKQQRKRGRLWIPMVDISCRHSLFGVGIVKKIYHERWIRSMLIALQTVDSTESVSHYIDQN